LGVCDIKVCGICSGRKGQFKNDIYLGEQRKLVKRVSWPIRNVCDLNVPAVAW